METLPFREFVDSYGGAAKLAEDAGVTRHAIYRYMRGERIPSREVMNKLVELGREHATNGVCLTHESFYCGGDDT